MPRIIALSGLAQAGKSTVASFLEEIGFVRVRFAGLLKGMLRGLGLTDRHIEGDLKEVPCDLLCGKTPRQAMQDLGTGWGRDMIGEDLWTNVWTESVLASIDQGARGVVAEDCRFPNEVAAVQRLGGQLWRVERPGLTAGAHISENALVGFSPYLTIQNDGPLEQLRAATLGALQC